MNDDAGSDHWDDLLALGKYDPRLFELTLKARDALDELAEYMARKALDTDAELPAEVIAFLERC